MNINSLLNMPPKQPGEFVILTRIYRTCPKCKRTLFHWGSRIETEPQKITAECGFTTECGEKWATQYVKEEWRD